MVTTGGTQPKPPQPQPQPQLPQPPARRARVTAHRVAETVAAELRSRILASAPGAQYELPTQEQLVRDFGVSHPSVREALRILETEGLVTVRRGSVGGAEAHRPDESSGAYHFGLALEGGRVTLGDLAAGLQLLEPLCAAECARRPDRRDAVVPALEDNLAQGAEVIGDGVAFTRVARAFHDLVVGFTPNATVRHVVSSLVALWSAQEEQWAQTLTERGEYPSRAEARSALRSHRRLVEEIAAGRPAQAERLARTHLAATQEVLLARFDGVVHAGATRTRRAGDMDVRSRL
jgi:GntR family transcriptional repressor for pyruvate dehydrogenase complex